LLHNWASADEAAKYEEIFAKHAAVLKKEAKASERAATPHLAKEKRG
jgi:hypothetical protein